MIKAIKDAIQLETSIGVQVGAKGTIGKKEVGANVNLRSINDQGEITQGAGVSVGLLGYSVEEKITPAKTEVKSEQGLLGRYISNTTSNTHETTISGSVGPVSVESTTCTTRTRNNSTGVVTQSKPVKKTNVKAAYDFGISVYAILGISIKIDLTQVAKMIDDNLTPKKKFIHSDVER